MPERGEDGIILVVVLWALIVLSALAAGFAIASRTYTRTAYNAATSARLAAAADAGVNRAILQLLDPQRRAERRVDGLAGAYGCRFSADVALTIRVTDEAGKVDINYGDERLLLRLVAATGVADREAAAVVDRIVDFRDSDDLRRPSGAEAPEYRAAGLDHGSANREFLSIDELEQVLRMPVDLVAAIRPFVTVHSRLTGIDPDVADPALLDAVFGAALRAESSPQPRAPLNLPAELRIHSSRTAYTIAVAADVRTGGRFVREASVRLNADGSLAAVTWERSGAEGSRETIGDRVMGCW